MAAQRRTRPRSAYLPFGGGRRICIGQSFALMEMVLMAAIMSQQFTSDLRPDYPVELEATLTLRPRHGVQVIGRKGVPMTTPDYQTVIIGAGFSGIGAAIKLDKAGLHDYLVIEAGAEAGGTWYWNTYPGIAVDIPSFSYQFSFEQSPRWSRTYAPGHELTADPTLQSSRSPFLGICEPAPVACPTPTSLPPTSDSPHLQIVEMQPRLTRHAYLL